jgi:hypothetical protein
VAFGFVKYNMADKEGTTFMQPMHVRL